MSQAKHQFLLKMRQDTGVALADRKLTLAGLPLQLTPLFQVPAVPASGFGVASTPPAYWYLAETEADIEDEHPWDRAHGVCGDRRGVASESGILLLEPDLLQNWLLEPPPQAGVQLLAAVKTCVFEDQKGNLPKGPGFAWHLADSFSGLKSARDAVMDRGAEVVIAHLDTGYDPGHVTLPEDLDTTQQRNFVDADRPKDATDQTPDIPMVQNRGHGTGTLSILAGNKLHDLLPKTANTNDYLGGAPKAKVVPVRVGNSVVQFRTSAIAKAFNYAREIKADIVSMSMGGLASAAWADAVNAAYEAGIVIVCAAGNNFGGFPTRYIVYPARFRRVIAACGVMADKHPYFNLPIMVVQGNFGPSSKMDTAMAAFTPNVTWAKMGCSHIVDMDGQGTSAATPQVAAAAALWLRKYKSKCNYQEPWMRVEAVRKALFESASKQAPNMSRVDIHEVFGNGLLQGHEALGRVPAAAADLKVTPHDSAVFAFLRVLTGLGLAAQGPRAAMLQLEMTQLAQQSKALEEAVPDPDIDPDRIPIRQRQRFLEAIIEEGKCSRTLRDYLEQQLVTRPGYRSVRAPIATREPVAPATQGSQMARRAVRPRPTCRRLRVFAIDPSLSTHLDTAFLNEVTVSVPWEASDSSDNLLQPGPVGEYLEVVDVDPSSGCAYAPLDLNDPYLLAQDGLAPSEGNPQFHQQIVYAVSMMTIRSFEQALGRVALWAPRRLVTPGNYHEFYVPRLRIYPHALRQANAYYSPVKEALLFGYFPAARRDPGSNLPGGMVFACLSHDIVAHETTHALLDGLHRRFQEATNPDVLAFHEAFADIVAIFQHFTFPEVLRYQIQKVGGDLAFGDLLADLARQFGEAMGRSRALRSAIHVDPAKINYNNTTEPHDRGSILVAAVFDAFLAVYRRRIADLLRIATGGSGVLPTGALHPDLVNRLADEAAKTSRHILNICIRALDYCPPVDITFGNYLRALITADFDLVPDDPYGYRIAFLDAFRRREIYPDDIRTLSVESLRWQEPVSQPARLGEILAQLNLDWDLFKDRRQAYEGARANATKFWQWLVNKDNLSRKQAEQMGIDLSSGMKVEVHSVRPARRVAPDGSFLTDLVVVLTQRRPAPPDPNDPAQDKFWFRGGCTLLIDSRKGRERIRYSIMKNINNELRLEKQREFRRGNAGLSLNALYFSDALEDVNREPFAMLHIGF